MGIFDAAESNTTLTRQNNWTPEQQALFLQLQQQASGGLNQGSNASYPGQTYAPQNQYETAYLNNSVLSPDQVMTRENALKSILSGTPAFTVDPTQSQNYYQSAFYNPAMQEYTQKILPQVMESASGAGFRSSDTLRQMGQSGTDLATNLAAKRAELVWNDILAGRTAQENALTRQSALAGSPTNIMTGYNQQLGTAGSYARQIENEQIQGQLARWLSGETVNGQSNPAYNPNTQLALSLLGLSPFSYGSNTDQTGAGLGYGLLQGLSSGTGSAIGAGLVSGLSNVNWTNLLSQLFGSGG